MIELLSRHGGAAFMSQFGDLPGPNPNLFHMQGIHLQSIYIRLFIG